MASTYRGIREWRMSRDDDGHREYEAKFLVETDDPDDGPSIVSTTVGLPQPGDSWQMGNDSDSFAYATLVLSIEPHAVTNEKNQLWLVSIKFSSKSQGTRCKDKQIEDPLQTPDRVSGSFVKFNEEATLDRFGRPVVNSAHEQIRGPQIEFDVSKASVKIEQNVSDLQLDLVSALIDTVNDAPIWGLQRRCVKLSNFSFDTKYQGQCYKYYTRTLEFDINPRSFDRNLLDEGTKALNGEWDRNTGHWKTIKIGGQFPNRNNPAHFSRYKDRKGENTKVVLDGHGTPHDPTYDVTTSCSQCPLVAPNPNLPDAISGAPVHWKYFAYDSDPRESEITGRLTYFQQCRWADNGGVYPPPDPTYTGSAFQLQYRSTGLGYPGGRDVPTWVLSYNTPTADWYWLTEHSEWNCLGPNTMVISEDASAPGGPQSYIVYASSDSQIGNIHVEKYQEGNFLLLGIPTEI